MEPNLNHKFVKMKIYFFPKTIHFSKFFPKSSLGSIKSPCLRLLVLEEEVVSATTQRLSFKAQPSLSGLTDYV